MAPSFPFTAEAKDRFGASEMLTRPPMEFSLPEYRKKTPA
jgi:hypothetical protein